MKTEALQSIRTNVHTDLFNRLNHYNSILAAQSQIDNKRQKTYSMISSFNSKRWHEIEKERINLNKKLMNSLGKIDLKYHLYTTIQQCEKKKKKNIQNNQKHQKITMKLIKNLNTFNKKIARFSKNWSKYAHKSGQRSNGDQDKERISYMPFQDLLTVKKKYKLIEIFMKLTKDQKTKMINQQWLCNHQNKSERNKIEISIKLTSFKLIYMNDQNQKNYLF